MSPPLRDEPIAAACGVRRHELMRLRFGELTAPRASELASHVEGCAVCRERLASVEADDAAFRAAYDPGVESVRILERLEKPRSSGIARWFALAAATAAALALGVMLLPFGGTEDRERLKGAAVSLEMYVNTPSGPKLAGDGIQLIEGDQVQFRYRAGGRRYLMVVSKDATGTVTPLYPADGSESLRITPEGVNVLEGSIILDGAVGPETVIAFFSHEPLRFDDVASRTGGDLPGVEEAAVHFEKRPPGK